MKVSYLSVLIRALEMQTRFADPEVGLTATDAGGVIINIGELAGIFQQIRATRPPEVNDGRESGTDREVEAEFTDITSG